MIGILNVLKPKGKTSSNIVVKIKKILNLKKVGHMGTLDPLASGVLVIGIGKATRLFDFFLKKEKTYIADFKFGEETSTLDSESPVIKKTDIIPTQKEIEKTLPSFLGEIEQIPPQFSSKKVQGKNAYALARKGIEVDLKPCKVTIFDFSLIKKIDNQSFRFLIKCSSGTYIRAIGRDLAKSLNTVATMTCLERIKTGDFKIENSLKFDDLTKDNIEKNLINLNTVLKNLQGINLSDQDYKKLRNGVGLYYDSDENKNFALLCENKVVGIGQIKNKILKISTFLDD